MFLIKSVRVSRSVATRRRGCVRGRHVSWSLGTMWLEQRVLLTGTLQHPVQIAIGAVKPGSLAIGGTDFYEIQPGSDGRLIAQTFDAASGLQLRLSIYDGQGNLLVQSDGQSSADLNPLIDQHVASGTDILEVQSLAGSGSYSLTTSLTPASDPSQTLGLPADFQGGSYAPIAAGDFTNNGVTDIVAPDGLHLGTGDGTFEAPTDPAFATPDQVPTAIAVGDFNDDHNLDVAIALGASDSISISMGNGDGAFQPASTIALSVPGVPDAILAGDFGNGQTDLAVAIIGPGDASGYVVVLMGNGEGSFTQSSPIPVGLGPDSITSGNFGPNGHFLAIADIASSDVTILTNQGGGSFSVTQTIQLPAFANPTSIVAGDFGNGNLDLAVTDSNASDVYILKGNGDFGTFQVPASRRRWPSGLNPTSIVAGDFGNGHLDLAVADANSNAISVLLGNGDGASEAAIQSPDDSQRASRRLLRAEGVAAGSGPTDVVRGDYNGDGRPDQATGKIGSSDISVLLGKGDGSFEEPPGSGVGNGPAAVATGDFDRQRQRRRGRPQRIFRQRDHSAGQWRRHVPATLDRRLAAGAAGRPGAVVDRGGRLQQRRPHQPGRRRAVSR